MTSRSIEWGKRIKSAREAKNFSQTQLAAMVGVTQGAVGHWEVGRSTPRDEMRMRLSIVLGVDHADLFPLMLGAAA